MARRADQASPLGFLAISKILVVSTLFLSTFPSLFQLLIYCMYYDKNKHN